MSTTRIERTKPVTLLALLAALALSPLGCGEPPVPASDNFFNGDVRLTGDLAEMRSGFLFVVAREHGKRAPILVRRYNLGDMSFRIDGADRVLPWELRREDFMGGVEMELPEKVELKISFDVDGDAGTTAGNETQIIPVQPGLRSYTAVLSRGMPVPDEPPSALDTLNQQPANEEEEG